MPDSPLTPPLPTQKDNLLQWGGLAGNAISLAISNLAASNQGPLLLITPDVHSATQLQLELNFFGQHFNYPIIQFPDWETLPYDHFSPHQDIISERLLTLYHLPKLKQGIVIVSLPTLMQRLLPQKYLIANSFVLACGNHFDLTMAREQFIHAGYRSVGQVLEHGEFAVRGSIIDIYPMGSKRPYRIELLDDKVESIRSFDQETQRSIEKIDNIQLLPAREYPLTEDAITHFRQAWRAKFSGDPQAAPTYQQISRGEAAAGVEYYLPLFYDHLAKFFDYLPANTRLLMLGDLKTTAEEFWNEIKHRFEQLNYDTSRPLCAPEELFLSPEKTFQSLKQFPQIKIQTESFNKKTSHINFSTALPPKLLVDYKAKQPLESLQNFLNNFITDDNARVLFCAESTGRREALIELLKEINISPTICTDWKEFLTRQTTVEITIAPLDQGLILTSPKIALITESQLFGAQVMQRRLRKQRKLDANTMIRDLTELNVGAPVVHVDHGVGRYIGLQVIKTGDHEAEYLTLEYAGGDKIYVPVSSLHLISRYTGADAEHAPLQKLGSKQWDKIKEKSLKQIRDVAAELLDIYGRREATPGFVFKKPEKDYQTFRSAFPFEETPDQQQAINEVITDMMKKRSMDRLICGDVGFGKTEVAMRAAFIATQNNKQVAILVPTTLLAEQHLHNFQDRFANWPIKIAAISRLRTTNERQQIIKELATGKIDIIIGTHKLLGQDIQFKDLGLLIVDEEHRFGVRQKERIKSLRAHVDILTLTATPIPRTLNMALAGTRDLSIIASPPAKRLSVKTFVHEYNPTILHEAIMRETMRGGQVYFLHNDVATITTTAEKLQAIVPAAKIAVAHGQMRERELEHVMSDFYHQKYNILVCSTIIESGIDIPTANTIIINRADRFGLAQLHQLRGRVGRSHHQAYAYLLTPPHANLTPDAVKRLEAIAQLDDLGVGFSLATHDLEIRGAGELLGVEQSGQIHAIGFSLYLELLEDAVKALKSGHEPALEKPLKAGTEIDLGVTALLPNDYIPDVHTRLTLYKRLASCNNQQMLNDIKTEMIDRFGLLPEPAQNLFQYSKIQQNASKLGIKKIEVGSKYGYIHFQQNPPINMTQLLTLIQKQPQQYQLQANEKLRFTIITQETTARLTTIQHTIEHLLRILK